MMNVTIYNDVMREYDKKRQIEEAKCEKRKQEIFTKIPKLKKLEDRLNKIAIDMTKTILLSNDINKDIAAENLEYKINEIKSDIEKTLRSEGYSMEDLKPNYECKECKDTGIINDGEMTKQCKCFMQKMIDITYNQSNMNKLDDENFNTFDIGFYSTNIDKEKYNSDISPKDNIILIKKFAEDFIKKFDEPNQKNLFFTGNTGLGKTFIVNCIANEIIKKGKTVLYKTESPLMDMVLDYKFGQDKAGFNKSQYNKIFDADLLIIDDLGTGAMNNTRFAELFNIINTRLLNNKKMIISTNLNLSNLFNTYEERIVSRLIGNFMVCKFFGEDIRLKKKKI